MYESIREKLDTWQEVAGEIWKNPELAYQEYFACKKQLDTLSLLGFRSIENPYCGLETAYRAEFENGENGPVFAVCAEYDALPGLGMDAVIILSVQLHLPLFMPCGRL